MAKFRLALLQQIEIATKMLQNFDEEESLETRMMLERDMHVAANEKCWFLNTNIGLEAIVLQELESKLNPATTQWKCIINPFGLLGIVAVVSDLSQDSVIFPVLMQMRCIHDILHFHQHFRLSTSTPESHVTEILSEIPKFEVPSMVNAKSFRVSCRRQGSHAFPSTDLERDIGEILHEKYNVPGKMTGFEVEVRVNVSGFDVVVGTQLTRDPLSKRHKLAFVRTVTLKPNVAYAMLHLSGFIPGNSMIDPCCGSGTIVLEAATLCLLNNNTTTTAKGRLVGCDRSAASVKGSVDNARVGGLAEITEFHVCNARSLEKIFERESFDQMVSNLPWGIQTGKDCDLEKIYKGMLCSASSILKPNGIIVAIVLRIEMFLSVTRQCGFFAVESLLPIRTGDMNPTICVLRKRHIDYERRSVKCQIDKITKYFLSLETIPRVHKEKEEKEEVKHEEEEEEEEIDIEAEAEQ